MTFDTYMGIDHSGLETPTSRLKAPSVNETAAGSTIRPSSNANTEVSDYGA